MERKAKKDEKLRRKREDAESGEGAEEGGAGGEDTAIEGMISAEDAEALGLRMPPPPATPPKA